MTKRNWTRKEFLKTSLIGGGSALIASNRISAAIAAPGSANGDIRVAVVGLNKQGAGHMRTYFDMPGARLVALCDVDTAVLERRKDDCSKAGLTVATFKDYRKLLEQPDVDVVVLATPNHQHSIQAIWGLQAGKDVYVEKPLSHNVWEGRQVVEAARRYSKNIVYAGSQNRSSEDNLAALEIVRSGKLGKIQWVRSLCYKMRESIGSTTGPQPVPETIDYDLWTGPAAMLPPMRNSAANGAVHYDWHWFWNYGGGDITNQGVHQMDVGRWYLGENRLPKSVMSFGGRFGYEDDAETPNTLISYFDFDTAPLIFEVRGLPMKAGMRAMDRYRAARIGVIVQCENGYVHASENGTVSIYDNDHKLTQSLAAGGNEKHRANFIRAVRNRDTSNASVADLHLSSALCHMGNVSYLVGRSAPTSEVADAVKSSELTKETFERTVDHLKANDVDVEGTPSVLGPLLNIDSSTETFVGPDKSIVDAANANPLRKRAGREGFQIPDFTG